MSFNSDQPRDADGKFSYVGSSADPKDHAMRAEHHAKQAEKHMKAAIAEKDPAKSAAHAVAAQASAKKAIACRNRAIKTATKNPTAESAAHVARAQKAADLAKQHADNAKHQGEAKKTHVDEAPKVSTPKVESAAPKGEYTPSTATTEEHADRAVYHAERAASWAEKAKNATSESEKQKALAHAAVSAKHAATCARRAEKSGGDLNHVLRAKEAATKAKQSAIGKPTPPTQAVITAAKTNAPLMPLADHEFSKYGGFVNDKLSSSEKSAVVAYSGHSYASINGGLRKPPPSEETQKKIDKLDAAIAKTAAPKDMIVYRGCGAKETIGSMKPGDVYNDKGFMSTSIAEKVAKEQFNSGVVFNIHVPEGHPILPIRGGQHDNEKEMLLPRGTNLKILSVEKTTNKWGSATVIVHARVHV